MKRIAYIVIIMAMALILFACGGQTKVPDSLIELEIETEIRDYLYENDKDDFRYSYTVDHKSDSSMHTDTLTVCLKIEGDYGYYQTYNSFTYQYDRSSDLWNLKQKGDWTEEEVVIDAEKYVGEFSRGMSGDDFYCYLKITSIDSISDNKLIATGEYYLHHKNTRRNSHVVEDSYRGSIQFDAYWSGYIFDSDWGEDGCFHLSLRPEGFGAAYTGDSAF